jgi:hypothetical protein
LRSARARWTELRGVLAVGARVFTTTTGTAEAAAVRLAEQLAAVPALAAAFPPPLVVSQPMPVDRSILGSLWAVDAPADVVAAWGLPGSPARQLWAQIFNLATL